MPKLKKMSDDELEKKVTEGILGEIMKLVKAKKLKKEKKKDK